MRNTSLAGSLVYTDRVILSFESNYKQMNYLFIEF